MNDEQQQKLIDATLIITFLYGVLSFAVTVSYIVYRVARWVF